MRRRLLAPIAMIGVLALAAPATGVPVVAISIPEDGATISRSTGSALQVGGAVEFAVPEKGSRRFYVRRTSCNADQRLSITRGSETAGCAQTVSLTPVAEETATAVTYAAENGVPFTLDATQPITGTLSLVSYLLVTGNVGVGAGLVTADISVTGAEVGGAEQALGSTTISYTATPATYRVDTPWSIAPPATLDKKDFLGLTLSITVRGRNALHGFTRPNDTNFLVPIWTASFNRRVEVAIDNGSFTSTGISVGPDLTTWSGSRPWPSLGTHVLRARAVQGGVVSGIDQRAFTITS
ncbi:MAG TPA: hypothetical protein VM638_02830 [Actinomycetota bacterium]|nr:hypothetical protein [Actinomycetota bacterium]